MSDCAMARPMPELAPVKKTFFIPYAPVSLGSHDRRSKVGRKSCQMSRIFVDKNVVTWKSFQKLITLGFIAPCEIQAVSRRECRRVSSEIAAGCLVSPGFE